MSAADTVERIAREAIEQTGLSRVDLAWVFKAVSRGYEAGFADCRETAMRAARELAATILTDSTHRELAEQVDAGGVMAPCVATVGVASRAAHASGFKSQAPDQARHFADDPGPGHRTP